jgi:predicted molibdopterin-dependent oxidoreductase YjgC
VGAVVSVNVPGSDGQGTVPRVSARIREVLGEVDHLCHSCGAGCAVAIETRPAARLRDRFRRGRDGRVRRFEMCVDCGCTVRVLPPTPRPVGGVDPFGAGWVAL